MKQRLNKSTLMLLEIMINICFFAALIAICLVLLFRAFHISNRAAGVSHSVSILNSIAAVYESSNGDYDEILSRFPEAYSEGDKLLFYYNEEFQPTIEADAVYRAILTADYSISADGTLAADYNTTENGLLTAQLVFEQIENQEQLYEEELIIHVPFTIDLFR